MLQCALICTLLTLIALPASAAPAKVERRCGWFKNPTPANATLTDHDGVWDIATQGGYQAEGDWPTFNDQQWVRTNNHYGYGCACVSANADPQTHRLDQLHKAKARPLSACRDDPSLYEPMKEEAGEPVLPKGSPRYQGQGLSLQYPKGWKLGQAQNCLTLDHPKNAQTRRTPSTCARSRAAWNRPPKVCFSIRKTACGCAAPERTRPARCKRFQAPAGKYAIHKPHLPSG